MTGAGPPLDLPYIVSLGPHALPVLDRYIAATGIGPLSYAVTGRTMLATSFHQQTGDWRAWGFRGWRLRRYLDKHPGRTPAPNG